MISEPCRTTGMPGSAANMGWHSSSCTASASPRKSTPMQPILTSWPGWSASSLTNLPCAKPLACPNPPPCWIPESILQNNVRTISPSTAISHGSTGSADRSCSPFPVRPSSEKCWTSPIHWSATLGPSPASPAVSPPEPTFSGFMP